MPAYNKDTDVFEDSISIHPNMNGVILREFNDNTRIQELLKTNSLFGEMLMDDDAMKRDIARLLVIQLENSAIQIVSLREVFDSLMVGFRFLDTGFGATVCDQYLRDPQSFTFRARGFSTNAGHAPQFNLVTIDMIFSPPSNRKNRR